MLGMNFTVNNVFSNPIPDLNNWTGHGLLGGDAGLQFTVDSGIPEDGYVKVSELDSSRTDLLWGTYRASMKLSLTPGTCAAFFWVSFPLFKVRDSTYIACTNHLLVLQ